MDRAGLAAPAGGGGACTLHGALLGQAWDSPGICTELLRAPSPCMRLWADQQPWQGLKAVTGCCLRMLQARVWPLAAVWQRVVEVRCFNDMRTCPPAKPVPPVRLSPRGLARDDGGVDFKMQSRSPIPGHSWAVLVPHGNQAAACIGEGYVVVHN
jgi:hypothetical protein